MKIWLRPRQGGSAGIGCRWRCGRTVRSAQRQIVRHLAGQLLRPRRLAGFVHRGRHFRARVAGRNPRRRLSRCTRRGRRNLWRFDWHLDRGFAMVARSGMRTGHRHVSLHWFCSDNDSDAAMFRSAALNAQAEPVQISQVFAGLFHQPFQRRQDPRAIWTAEPRACIPAGAGAVRAIVAFADIAENAGRQILVQNRIEEPERLSQ